MILKNKCLKFLVVFSLMSSQLFASTLNVNPVENTFLNENIKNVFTTTKGYISVIASDNTVKLAKLSDTTNWSQIKKDQLGNYLYDIVQLDSVYTAYDEVYAFLSSDGDVYTHNTASGLTYSYATKEAVKFLDVGLSSDGYSTMFLVGESGKLYHKAKQVSTLTEISGDKVFKKAFCVVGSTAFALGEDNKLYYYNGSMSVVKDATGLEIDNINDIWVNSKDNNVYLLTSNGKVFKKSNSATNPVCMTYVKDGITLSEDDVFVYENITNNATGGFVALRTNLGVFTGTNTSLTYNEELTNMKALGIQNNSTSDFTVIDAESKIWRGDSLSNLSEIDISEWGNKNPIVYSNELANIDIKLNSIHDRKSDLEFKFSLVSNKEIKAFNIFHVKTDKINDREAWVQIEDNISVDELNPVDYVTGYEDTDKNEIKGKTYTYNWKLGVENLSNIRVIVEPVYQDTK